MTSPARAAADLAALLPRDDDLARVARMTLEHLTRTEIAVSEHGPTPDVDVRIGSPTRDASVDPCPNDLVVKRPPDGQPDALMWAHVDDPEFINEVARRRAEEAVDE